MKRTLIASKLEDANCLLTLAEEELETAMKELLISGTMKQVFVVGNGGTIVRSGDSGQTWTSSASPVNVDLGLVWGGDANHVWAAGGGVLLRSTDGGDHWQVTSLPENKTAVALWARTPDELYVLTREVVTGGGNHELLFRSRDGGATLSHVPEPALQRLDYPAGVCGFGADELFVVTHEGRVYRAGK